MSLLNQLFNRGVFASKCKTCLTLAVSRIKLLQNKRDLQLKHMRKEIAQFLQAGQEPIARIRVEHVIREQNIWAAYEILELFCEFVIARIPILESQKDCPSEMREAIASIIFAAPRCSDIPDLLHVKNLFSSKYGKEFVMAVSELRPDSGVNRAIIEKLSVSAPSPESRLNVLKEIAEEYNIGWDSSKTEAELRKKHEDLLTGSKQICAEALPVTQGWTKQSSAMNSVSNGVNSTTPTVRVNPVPQSLTSPSNARNVTVDGTGKIEASSSKMSTASTAMDESESEAVSQLPLDVLEMARAAIASAERASASARAAAKLANVNYGASKVDGTLFS